MATDQVNQDPAKVGEVRPSQLIHTYGAGSVVELPNFSVIVPGLDGGIHGGNPWSHGEVNTVIEEERLLELVQTVLKTPGLTQLRGPVRLPDEGPSSSPRRADWFGTWTVPFPRWLRCSGCNALSRYDSGLFQLSHTNVRRPHEAKYVHANCMTSNATAVPVRFVLACPRGHLDDFPWGEWAHRDQGYACNVNASPSSNLKLVDIGQGQRPTAQKVECKNNGCGADAAVQAAFGPDGYKNLPRCGGGRPHLGDREACDEVPRAVLVSATNLWFADKRTVLSIPHDEVSPITRVVREHRDRFEKRNSRADFMKFAAAMAEYDNEPWLHDDEWTLDDLWDEYERQEAILDGEVAEESPLADEWVALTQQIQGGHPDFQVEATKVPPATKAKGIGETRLVTRLREVSALIGFTRLDSPTEESTRRAALSTTHPRWVPASVSLGEGILVRLDETAVAAWEATAATSSLIREMKQAHAAWRARRNLEPTRSKSARFLLLHTLSHLLINEISHEAGYSAASIRERIYAQSPADGDPMAGVLIYTAAPDSEGTLGGLVSLGQPDRLGAIIDSAMQRAAFCTSDPFCATHHPNGDLAGGVEGDGTLHGAACHVCLFVSETSCEHANRYLDRSLLVPTLDGADVPTFLA